MSNPELAEHYATIAADATREGKFDVAEYYLMQALEADSQCTMAYTNLASLYAFLGMKREALQAALKALSLDPDDVLLLYNAGTHAMQAGDYMQAAVHLKKAVFLNSRYSLAVFNLAMCYDLMGQIDDALLWYQRSTELDPDDPDPIYNMAEIYFRTKTFAYAEKLCQQALTLFQKRFEVTQFTPFFSSDEPLSREQLLADIAHRKAVAHHLMALIQANMGKLKEALESIQSAINIYPRNAKWFVLMAQIHHHLGNHTEAKDALGHAMKLDSSIANDIFGRIGWS